MFFVTVNYNAICYDFYVTIFKLQKNTNNIQVKRVSFSDFSKGRFYSPLKVTLQIQASELPLSVHGVTP